MGGEKSGLLSREQPQGPLAPIRAFSLPNYLFGFLSPPLAPSGHHPASP